MLNFMQNLNEKSLVALEHLMLIGGLKHIIQDIVDSELIEYTKLRHEHNNTSSSCALRKLTIKFVDRNQESNKSSNQGSPRRDSFRCSVAHTGANQKEKEALSGLKKKLSLLPKRKISEGL